MNLPNKKNLLLGFLLFAILLSIPLTISLMQHKQEPRSRATASTTLSLLPFSSSTAPIQKNIGDTIPLDITVDPGTHLITFIRFQIQFDPTVLQLDTANPFTLNSSAFPVKVEGPVISSSSAAESVSIGSDSTKSIQNATKVGTLNFKAVGATNNTPTLVSFTSLTQALSAGSTDQASQNVLSTTLPAYIVISASGQLPSQTISPVPTVQSTSLTVTLLLHGVGSAGDNPNPGGTSMSNKNPLHPQRNLDIEITDNNNQIVASASGNIIYSSQNGSFAGIVDLGPGFPSGFYNIRVTTDRYLRKLVSGVQKITNLANNTLPATTMVAGDVNGDNVLNVLDYNAFLDCGYGDINPLPMQDPNSTFNTRVCKAHTPVINVDLDDNGIINSPDYNLFLRELSVQNGD